MFVNDIDSAVAGAAVFAAPSIDSSHAGTVTLNVRIGRMLAAAAFVVAPALWVAPAHGAGFSISDPSGACGSWTWSSGTSTLTCNAAVVVPGVPSCSLSASPSSITVPTSVTLTASCTNTDANTTYAWTGAGTTATTSGASPSAQAVSVSATTNFTVIATNATGPSNVRSATVTLGSGGGGGGGGGGTIPTCDGPTGTIKMNFNYVPGTGQIVQTSQGMLPTDILVATFTTPATIAGGTGSGGSLQITDNVPNTAGFVASLSTSPCSVVQTGTWASGGNSVKSGQSSASWNFSTYNLKPSTQYFVTITSPAGDPISVKLLAK